MRFGALDNLLAAFEHWAVISAASRLTSLSRTPIARAYLWRGCVLWAAARSTLALMLLLTGGPSAVRASLGVSLSAISVVPLTVLLGMIDVRRHGQRLLLANLGVSDRTLAALLTGASALGEGALALALKLA